MPQRIKVVGRVCASHSASIKDHSSLSRYSHLRLPVTRLMPVLYSFFLFKCKSLKMLFRSIHILQYMNKNQNAITVRTKVRWRSECPSERIRRIRRGSARRSIRPPPNKSWHTFPNAITVRTKSHLAKLALLRYLGDAAARSGMCAGEEKASAR